MSELTEEEKGFLLKLEERRKKHAEAQAKYRQKIGKEAIAKYNSEYRAQEKAKLEAIKKKLPSVPTPLNLAEITKEAPKLDKRTRRGRKQAQVQPDIITPMYQKRKEPLAYTTINNYLNKVNILQRIFDMPALTLKAKNELKKLFNDNPDIDEKLLLEEMPYINNDINTTIEFLRETYPNDNSFKGYLLTLTTIASHLKNLDPNVYQTLTKSAIAMNKAVQKKRKDNAIADEDKDKLIDLDRKTVLDKIKSLNSTEDKLLMGVYSLMPARRLDWRLVKITTNPKPKNDDDNYLILGTKKKVVFNNYKTSTKYGQQIFDITDPVLNELIDQQIKERKLQAGQYLFGKQRDAREEIEGPVFSTKVSNTFKKAYGFPISVRFLRMSHVVHFMAQNPTENDREEFALKMAHSPDEQLLYRKKI